MAPSLRSNLPRPAVDMSVEDLDRLLESAVPLTLPEWAVLAHHPAVFMGWDNDHSPDWRRITTMDPLLNAAGLARAVEVSERLAAGADPNVARDGPGIVITALVEALNERNLTNLEKARTSRLNPDAEQRRAQTVIVGMLLAAGAQVTLPAWRHACLGHRFPPSAAMLTRLLADGQAWASEAQDVDVGTALHIVAQRAQEVPPDTVQRLLARGVDLDARNATGETAVFLASRSNHNAHTTRLMHNDPSGVLLDQLLRAGANPNLGLPGTHGVIAAPIHHEAQRRQATSLRRLLEHGADPQARCRWTTSNRPAQPFQTVQAKVRQLVTDALPGDDRLALAHQVHGPRFDGTRPIHHAAGWSRDPDAVGLLLAHGASVDDRDDEGHTPLHLAVAHDNLIGVNALLAAGADPQAVSHDGTTPMGLVGYLTSRGSMDLHERSLITQALEAVLLRQELTALAGQEAPRPDPPRDRRRL